MNQFQLLIYGWASYARTIAFFTLVIAILPIPQVLAQATTRIPLENLPHAVCSSPTQVSEGDTARFSFHLGTPEYLLHGAVGFEISLELAPAAQFPENFSPSYSDSWLAQPGLWTASTHLVSTHRTIRLTGLRESAAPEGQGIIFTFFIVADEPCLEAAHLLERISGTIVLIENLDARLLPPRSDVAWPNPAHDFIHVPAPENGTDSPDFLLISSDGQVAPLQAVFTWQASWRLDIQTLPPGRYVLRQARSGSMPPVHFVKR